MVPINSHGKRWKAHMNLGGNDASVRANQLMVIISIGIRRIYGPLNVDDCRDSRAYVDKCIRSLEEAAFVAELEGKSVQGKEKEERDATYDFTREQIVAAPRAGVGGAAIEAGRLVRLLWRKLGRDVEDQAQYELGGIYRQRVEEGREGRKLATGGELAEGQGPAGAWRWGRLVLAVGAMSKLELGAGTISRCGQRAAADLSLAWEPKGKGELTMGADTGADAAAHRFIATSGSRGSVLVGGTTSGARAMSGACRARTRAATSQYAVGHREEDTYSGAQK
ncbi:hypothetical protein C8R44DRAFT_754445 [Mycena epipterygia]|nr:hypothetical protein C8R44DRAFT_754445 [Mycena epipterygia]